MILITKENSKLKPLSISIAVDADSRLILAGKVSQIPAFGHLAHVAKKKYGRRECHHRLGLEALFKEIRPSFIQIQSLSRTSTKSTRSSFKDTFPKQNMSAIRVKEVVWPARESLKK